MALSTGCRLDPTLPADVKVRCQQTSDCPPQSQCRLALNRCFPLGSDAQPPRFTVSPSLTPTTAHDGDTVTVRFSVDETLDEPPRVVATFTSGDTATFTTGDDRTARDFTFTLPISRASPQGPASVVIQAFDPFGNLTTSSGELTLFVDSHPPLPGIASVQFEPAAGRPFVGQTALGLGASVFVSFDTDEPAAVDPQLRAEPDVVAFSLLSASDGVLTFVGQLKPGATGHGSLALTATLADLVGNRGDQPVRTPRALPFDAEACGFDAAVEITHVRHTDAPELSMPFSVTAGPGAVEPGVTVRALSDDGQIEYGRALADELGAFTIALPPPDHARVRVEAIDAAGNATAEQPVASIDYHMRPGDHLSLAGTTSARPFRDDGAVAAGSRLQLIDGQTLAIEGNATWRLRNFFAQALGAVASNSFAPALAYNPVTAQTVSYALGYTLGFDATDLARLNPDMPLRPNSALAFDRTRGLLVSFGGSNAREVFESPDGVDWVTRVPSGGPGPRTNHVLVYDGTGVQLLGGVSGSAPWRWSGDSWQALDAGAMPSGVVAAAYDPGANRVVALASEAGDRPQTWVFSDGAWSPLDAGPGPASSIGPMVFDTVAHVARMNAAVPDGGFEVWSLGDRWAFTGRGLPHRAQATSAFDENRGVWVIAGRPQPGAQFGSFAQWVDGGWVGLPIQSANPLGTSIGVWAVSAWYDPQRNVMVYFGGYNAANNPTNYQYSFDGRSWVIDTRNPPERRGAQSLAVTDAGVWLFGGDLDTNDAGNDLSALSYGADASWQPVTPTGRQPAGRFAHASAAFADGTLALWGGVGSEGSLWLTDGGSWLERPDAGEWANRQWAALAQYPPNGPWVSLGGSATTSAVLAAVNANTDNAAYLGDLSQFQRVSSALPPLRASALAADPWVGDLVFFGGATPQGTGSNLLASVTVQGSTLSSAPISMSDPEGDGVPSPRYGSSLVAYPPARSLLMVGGRDSTRGLREMWELKRWAQRPSLSTWVDAERIDLSGTRRVLLEVTATAGASGFTVEGAPLDGVSVDAFVEGQWRSLGTLAGSAQNLTTGTLPPLPLSPQSLVSTLGRIAIRVTALGGNGRTPARLVVDHWSVRLKFTRAP